MKKGFTLVELLITLTVFSIVIASVLSIYINSQKTKYRVDQMTIAQQASRNALDFMIKDIRSTGYSIDIEESSTQMPQRSVSYAGPYEMIFHCNIEPNPDTPENPQAPSAMKPGFGNPAHYTPSRQFTTGAETIVYTLDYNNDGIINTADKTSTEAAFTANPDDYALIKRVYGFNSATNSNGGDRRIVSIVGGPETGNPIFMYWYDHDGDPSTDDILWGDANSDGSLSSSEISALTPITSQETIDKITRVTITITGLTPQKVDNEYKSSKISTEVSITRNATIDVFYVQGHVYNDQNGDSTYNTGEPGLTDFKVKLNTGETATTDSLGNWVFAVIPGVYTAQVTPKLGFRPTTETNFDFTVSDTSVNLTTNASYKDYFGMEGQPIGYVMGVVFYDQNDNDNFEIYENTLDSMSINVYNNATLTSYDNGLGAYIYFLEVNAEESLYVWMNNRDSIVGDGFDDSLKDLGFYSTAGAMLYDTVDERTFKIYVPDAGTLYLAFATTYATGLPCTVDIIKPNGGELLRIGNTYKCSLYVDGIDDNIKRIEYYYSPDAGASWIPIDVYSYPSNPEVYFWTLNSADIRPTQYALFGARVTDQGNWIKEDFSDDYFSIIDETGFSELYFTSMSIDSMYDPTLFNYSYGTSDLWPTRYLNTNTNEITGVAQDSLDKWVPSDPNDRQLWGPFHNPQIWITPKGVPSTDTIWNGTWSFVIHGSHNNAHDSSTYIYYDIGVFLRDSSGMPATEETLFTTIPGYKNYNTSILRRDTIGNFEKAHYIDVLVNDTFPIDSTDRIILRVYWDGTVFATGSDDAGFIQMLYSGGKKSSVFLPPKP